MPELVAVELDAVTAAATDAAKFVCVKLAVGGKRWLEEVDDDDDDDDDDDGSTNFCGGFVLSHRPILCYWFC